MAPRASGESAGAGDEKLTGTGVFPVRPHCQTAPVESNARLSVHIKRNDQYGTTRGWRLLLP